MNVNVLGGKKVVTEEGSYTTGGVVQVDIDDLVSNNGNNNLIAKPISTKADSSNNTQLKAGYTLPNTGSAVDSTVLLLLSVLMIAAGFILRKRALN